MRRSRGTSVFLCVVLLCAAGSHANAALLNLGREHYPLVYTPNVSVTFTPDGGGKGLLAASGSPFVELQMDDSGGTSYLGSFSLQVQLYSGGANDGGVVSGGAHYLRVAYKTSPIAPEQVLFGSSDGSTDLLAFGYGAEDKFEFLFANEVGSLCDPGDTVAVVITANSIPDFSVPVFTDYFTNSSNGESNTYYLPEPATLMLLGLSGLAVIHRHRRRR